LKEEVEVQISELLKKAEKVLPTINIPQKKQKLLECEEESASKNFWDDREKAQNVLQRIEDLKKDIDYWENINEELSLQKELLAEAQTQNDKDAIKDIEKAMRGIEKEFKKKELQVFFSGKYDANGAVIAIHAGAGGVDAQDWAEMLMRMYLRFFESSGFKIDVLSQSQGEEAASWSLQARQRFRIYLRSRSTLSFRLPYQVQYLSVLLSHLQVSCTAQRFP